MRHLPSSRRGLVALAVIGGALGLWWLWPGTAMPVADGSRRTPAAYAGTPAEAPHERTPIPVPAGLAPEALRVYPSTRENAAVAGVVVDEEFRPVAGVALSLEPSRGGIHPRQRIADDRSSPAPTTSDGDGAFGFASVPHGPWVLRARSRDGRVAKVAFAAPWPAEREPLLLRLEAAEPPQRLQVRVTDAVGQPIAGARVALHLAREGAAILPADRESDANADTDVDGRCLFDRLQPAPWVLVATAADGRVGVALGEGGPRGKDGNVVVVVEAAGDIDGALIGDASKLDASAVTALRLERAEEVYSPVHGLAWQAPVRDGRFAFRALPVGRYALTLQSPHGLRLRLPPMSQTGTVVPWTALVSGNATMPVQCEVTEGGRIAGRVVSDTGAPIAGARVDAVFTPRNRKFPNDYIRYGCSVRRLDASPTLSAEHPATRASTVSDASGSYVIACLQPGLHCLEVSPPGFACAERLDIAVADAETTVVDFELAAAGVVQGVVSECPYGTVAAIPAGSAQPALLAVLPRDGTFTLPGLAAGEWTLARWSDLAIEPLATVRVDVGRTTWVDLRRRAPARLAGRVVDGDGQPLSGGVDLLHMLRRLQPDGSFAFTMPEPLPQQLLEQGIEVRVDGQSWHLPIPDAAAGAADWQGEFRLGSSELEITLRDLDDRPLAGTVGVSGAGIDHRAELGIGGKVVVRHLLAGEYRIGATLRDAIAAQQTVQLPGARVVTLRAAPAANIDVLVVDAKGRPHPYTYVIAYPGPDRLHAQPCYYAIGDANGVAHLLVRPGTVWVAMEGMPGNRVPPVAVQATSGVTATVTLRLQ
jgi:hypothetical protein